jgi:glyoxylase-like metal-dependent hydrolase (beta-lactamase superfamily II)
MKQSRLLPKLLYCILFLLIYCSPSGILIVEHQSTGPVQTNCYLVYDAISREAALVDPGGPVDSLMTIISDNQLNLKFIFSTHGHMDHMEYVPQVLDQFPDAKFSMSKDDWELFLMHIDWMEENWDPQELAGIKAQPEMGKWFEYDLSQWDEPDFFISDNETYSLGNIRIRTFIAPGHSKASVCYYADGALFSGDVLFYRRVGRTDLYSGSSEAIARSVRRLYSELPDSTRVYPGHGPFTTIGEEKLHNEAVTPNMVNL